jgi:hypothetical protein
MPSFRSWLLATAGWILAGVPPAGGSLPSSVVAYTGQAAPGTAGPTFELLFRPSISRDGDVAFTARLVGGGANSTNNYGIWRQSGGPLALFRRAGDASPMPSTTWHQQPRDPNHHVVGGAPRVGFKWRILDGGNSREAIWMEQPGAIRNVALQGTQATGMPAGALFGALQSGGLNESVVCNEDGETLFNSTVTGGGVTVANDSGLWLDDGATVSLLAREGNLPPGLPGGSFYSSDLFGELQLAPGGVAAFRTTANVAGFQREGIWSTQGGGVGLVAIERGGAPGLGVNEKLGLPSNVRLNRHGQIAFVAQILNQFDSLIGNGLWISDTGGNLELVLRSGDLQGELQPPLGSTMVLSDRGVAYFFGTYFSSPVLPRAGLFMASASGWRAVAWAGDRAAELPAGVVYSSFEQLVLNGKGQIGFRALLSGSGVVSTNNRALFAEDDKLAFRLVARTGQVIEVAPGVQRTLSTLNLTQPGSAGDGLQAGFSDNGGLVWLAGSGGSSAAILVTTLPVPPVVQLVGLEVVQVIQDWNGVVPLVQGKRAWVRAHFGAGVTTRVEPVLRARLMVGGAELPLSPLRAEDPDGAFTQANPANWRFTFDHSVEWLLPIEWTYDEIELEVELLRHELDCVEAATPIANDCKVNAEFEPMGQPKISVVGVSVLHNGGWRHPSPDDKLKVLQRMRAAFPVADIDWASAGHFIWKDDSPPEPNMCQVQFEMYNKKLLDKCDELQGCNRIYLGVVMGEELSGCADVGKYSAAARLLADEFAPGRQSFTHEITHVLGRHHSVDPLDPPLPNGRLQGFCGETAPAGTDPFEHIEEVAGVRRPTLGPLELGEDWKIFGIDRLRNKVVYPTAHFELMSYCAAGGVDRWPSRSTYTFLKSAIEARFPAPPPLDEAGFAPLGSPVLLVSGEVDSTLGTGTLAPAVTLLDGGTPTPSGAGAYTLRIARSGGGTEDLVFTPEPLEAEGEAPTALPFTLQVASPATVTGLALLQGAVPLANRSASANAPLVQVLSPNGGELLDDPTALISWTGSDADLDPVGYTVQFSPDDGASWTTLAIGIPSLSLEVEREALAGTTQGRFRVQASDGLRTAFDLSDSTFSVLDNPPHLLLVSPDDGRLYYDGQSALLEALAFDPEEGLLDGAAITWSSNLSGDLGTGSALTIAVVDLADGIHVVTVTAEDSAGNPASATVRILVDQPSLLFEDGFESGATTRWSSASP